MNSSNKLYLAISWEEPWKNSIVRRARARGVPFG